MVSIQEIMDEDGREIPSIQKKLRHPAPNVLKSPIPECVLRVGPALIGSTDEHKPALVVRRAYDGLHFGTGVRCLSRQSAWSRICLSKATTTRTRIMLASSTAQVQHSTAEEQEQHSVRSVHRPITTPSPRQNIMFVEGSHRVSPPPPQTSGVGEKVVCSFAHPPQPRFLTHC